MSALFVSQCFCSAQALEYLSNFCGTRQRRDLHLTTSNREVDLLGWQHQRLRNQRREVRLLRTPGDVSILVMLWAQEWKIASIWVEVVSKHKSMGGLSVISWPNITVSDKPCWTLGVTVWLPECHGDSSHFATEAWPKIITECQSLKMGQSQAKHHDGQPNCHYLWLRKAWILEGQEYCGHPFAAGITKHLILLWCLWQQEKYASSLFFHISHEWCLAGDELFVLACAAGTRSLSCNPQRYVHSDCISSQFSWHSLNSAVWGSSIAAFRGPPIMK